MAEVEQQNSPGLAARFRRLGVLVVLIVLVGGGIWYWWPRTAAPSSPPLVEAEDEPPLVMSNPGYLGPAVCAECHAAKATGFQKTRHYRACWSPERGPMPPAFTADHAMNAPREGGVQFQFSRLGTDFHQTVVRNAPNGPDRYPLKIDLIYGSGGDADEVYFTWKGNQLFELPMAWLYPLKEWGEQRYSSNPGDLTRTATTRCVECHNTWIGHVPGTENEYHREGAVFGVTCESCHGPGRAHVDHHRAHPGEKVGLAVVQPGRLSRDRLMDVCGQCHSNAIRARGPAFSYRPSEPLDAHFRTQKLANRESDHVAGQVGYLRESKCFQKSNDLTCVTCHDPHRQSDPAVVGAACAKCHKPADCTEQKRLPAGAGTDCVGCHMPRYNRVAVNFHTKNDQYVFPVRPHEHRIGVYPLARQEVLLAWYRTQPDAASKQQAERLATELAGQWRNEADRLRHEYRFVLAIGAEREAVRFDPSAGTQTRLREAIGLRTGLDDAFFAAERHFAARHYPDAVQSLEGILKVKPDWAQAHSKLGILHATMNNRTKAVEHLQAVARYNPDDASGYNMLGWLAYLDGKGEQAAEFFRKADDIQPFTAEINYRWGLSLLTLDRWTEATIRFRQALAVNPNHAGSCQGLSHAYRRQGQVEEAIRFARRAARLTAFENPDVLITLADAYADANRLDEALDAANRAVQAAETSAPDLVPKIRSRVRELQKRKG